MPTIPDMATHELKIWPQFFDAWTQGKKRAEIRINDRNYRVGDVVVLREYEKTKKKNPYTGRALHTKILHMTALSDVPGTHKKDANFVVLSLAPTKVSRSSPSAE